MEQNSTVSNRPVTRQAVRKAGVDQVNISRMAAELSRRSTEALQKKVVVSGQ